MNLQECAEEMKRIMATVTDEIDLAPDNRSAARRVRKATSELARCGKEYRRLSVEHDKAKKEAYRAANK